MDCSPEQIREWVGLISTFTWPVAFIVVVILFRDVVAHFFKTIIDFVFRRK